MIARIVVAFVALLALAGCAAATPTDALKPVPAPRPTAAAADGIGTTQATLPPVVDVVPPVRVTVPSTGIDVEIQPVGVAADGQMDLPANVAIAGWYRFGPVPDSEAGTTVLAAHVDSLEYGLGPFAELKGLAAGASVLVTTADGAVHEYAIESVQNVAKDQLPLADVFDRAGAPRLVLITCGGQFDYDALSYDENVIAVAVPVVP